MTEQLDASGRPRLYGIYRGIVVDKRDPLKKLRIKVKVPQVLGTATTNWADACQPVTNNAEHLDHKAHTAAAVVDLIANHQVTLSTASGGSPSHSHSLTLNLSHTPEGGELDHAHVTAEDPLDETDDEHTPHRKVPDVGQTVWVMFEAGDPDHPVWIGVLP